MKEMINLMPEMEAMKADAENLFKKVQEIVYKQKIQKIHDIACYWLTSDDCDSTLNEIIHVAYEALTKEDCCAEEYWNKIVDMYKDIEPEYSNASAEIKDVIENKKAK